MLIIALGTVPPASPHITSCLAETQGYQYIPYLKQKETMQEETKKSILVARRGRWKMLYKLHLQNVQKEKRNMQKGSCKKDHV